MRAPEAEARSAHVPMCMHANRYGDDDCWERVRLALQLRARSRTR